MAETREELQARAIGNLQAAAQRREEALRALEQATGQVRDATLAARRVEVPVRRAAEVGGVSPDTVNEWTKAHRADAIAQLHRKLQRATDPTGRGWYLADRFAEQWIRVGEGHKQVRLWGDRPSERAGILVAAYAAVLAADPGLAPGQADATDAVDEAMSGVGDLPPGAWLREVLAAGDPAPIDTLMAPLDRAARLLLDQPIDDWQAALRPHLPARTGPRTFTGVIGARQALDAILAPAAGGHAPGQIVTLPGGTPAVVTEARWDGTGGALRYLDCPARYMVTPANDHETLVDADQLTAQ